MWWPCYLVVVWHLIWSDFLIRTPTLIYYFFRDINLQQIWKKSRYDVVSLKPVVIPYVSLIVLWGRSDSDDKKTRGKGWIPPPPLFRRGKWAGSGCWRGVGGWMGPASDLRQKECPRLLSRPAPLAALHSVISAGAFCAQHPDPKPQSRGHRQAQSNTPEPPPLLHSSL